MGMVLMKLDNHNEGTDHNEQKYLKHEQPLNSVIEK